MKTLRDWKTLPNGKPYIYRHSELLAMYRDAECDDNELALRLLLNLNFIGCNVEWYLKRLADAVCPIVPAEYSSTDQKKKPLVLFEE